MPWLGAALCGLSTTDSTPSESNPAFENIPVYLKPSSSAFRKPSFYIPRMRESVEVTEGRNAIFRVDGLGSALPLFAISSASCEYYSLRLPLLKAGFKRLCAPLEGVFCNLIWGRSMASLSLGTPSSTSLQAISKLLESENALAPDLRERLSLALKEMNWASLLKAQNPYQRFNHFPLSHQNLGCKREMANNLRRIQLHIEQMNCSLLKSKGDLSQAFSGMADMYDFAPQTWAYPQEKKALLSLFRSSSSSEQFIWKPARGSCGRGIFLTQGHVSAERVMDEIDKKASGEKPGGRMYRQYVVQKYIDNPLLLDGKKMDLRLYVAVTSYNPLTVYLHEEGLVRLAAEPYANDTESELSSSYPSNVNEFDNADVIQLAVNGLSGECTDAQFRNRFRHLTNYSIGRKYPALRPLWQRGSFLEGQTHPSEVETSISTQPHIMTEPENVEEGELKGVEMPLPELKWSLQRLWTHLDREYSTKEGGNSGPFLTPSERLKEEIALIITRVLMSVRPTILQALHGPSNSVLSSQTPSTRTGGTGFFELYGFDIMLDNKLNPKLLEVNTMPSLESSSDFDYAVKSNVVADLLNLSMMEAFERPQEALSPFVKNSDHLHSPDITVRPYIHSWDKFYQAKGGDQTPQIYSSIQQKEITLKLADELEYARGFKRIFPPVSARELARNTSFSSNYPIDASSRQSKKDLEAYNTLEFLTQEDEWALESS
ncbi:unnamed protein product [Phytomonas sp. Hart1]|nr:unnamed protein product [Phytomonas sp. Hart1]|eukprot:CCW68095.1 unnamed protein product [Phytomonas sp. isolate Hart1]